MLKSNLARYEFCKKENCQKKTLPLADKLLKLLIIVIKLKPRKNTLENKVS